MGQKQFSLRMADRGEGWGVAIGGRLFEMDGYIRVAPEQRGAVDQKTGTRHAVGTLTFEQQLGDRTLLTFRGSTFGESRNNGTPLTWNSSEAHAVHVKLEYLPLEASVVRLDLYAESTDFRSTFSSVNTDRSNEQLVLDQYSVPATAVGFGFVHEHRVTMETFWSVGLDGRTIRGETRETVFFQDADRKAGGSQNLLGMHIQGQAGSSERWVFNSAFRIDYWQSRDGFLQQPNVERQIFPSRERWVASARGGVRATLGERTFVRAAVYQAYRVPTLNELYRPFQVGADQTLANPELGPERLLGYEAGLDWILEEGAEIRVTIFRNAVWDSIMNVTIGSTAAGGQVRQRQSVERAQTQGVEVDAAWLLGANLRLRGAYAYTDAVVARSEVPELVNKRLAQVAKHSGNIGLRYTMSAIDLQWEGNLRWTGAQFEDDLNTRRLHGYLQVDGLLMYSPSDNWQLRAGITNLLDRRFPDGITGQGLITLGAPRTLYIGLMISY
ncbi:MAG: TonB-dependent receptor [Verrucomicrobia bacterium]|nr:TonB-dependent receptor [Verrucomicrobiota bacterium]